MRSNYILGSGLVALLCKKILGQSWKILPIGPSRFYSSGVPAWSDDFVIKDQSVDEIIKDWNLNKLPLFYKRALSIGGQLVYNNVFIPEYLNKIGLPSDPLNIDYFKSNFVVYSFSCLQLWDYLLKDYVNEINEFHSTTKMSEITSINDHIITIKTENGDKIIEYDKIVSTIPINILFKLLNVNLPVESQTTYHYYIEDPTINIEGANQVLVADALIPFHKCTKINGHKYLIEIINDYKENIYEILMPILGDKFEILKAHAISNGYINKLTFNLDRIDKLNKADIILIGSLAQADPLMDISSCIKRIYNLSNHGKF